MEEGVWRIILKQIAHNLAESGTPTFSRGCINIKRKPCFILDLTENEKTRNDEPFSFL